VIQPRTTTTTRRRIIWIFKIPIDSIIYKKDRILNLFSEIKEEKNTHSREY